MLKRCAVLIFTLISFLTCQAKTMCGAGYTERDYPVGWGQLDMVFDWSWPDASPSVEDLAYDESSKAGGCPMYWNITGHIGTFINQNDKYDIYSVIQKQYKRPYDDRSKPCSQVGVDWDQPPRLNIKEPGKANPGDTIGGIFAFCVTIGDSTNKLPRNQEPPEPKTCPRTETSTPNPIFLPTGDKYLERTDWLDSSPNPLTLNRMYNSGRLKYNGWGQWSHNFEEFLEVIGRTTSSVEPNYVRLMLQGARREYFIKTEEGWKNTNGNNVLTKDGSGWVHRDMSSGDVVNFDTNGLATKRLLRNGWEYVYSYTQPSATLASVTNSFGRALHFDYSGLPEFISVKMNDEILLSYIGDGSSNIDGVDYPDGSGERYEYNRVGLSFIRDRLGNIADEFRYDGDGRAIYSAKPQNASVYQVSYGDGSVLVKNPLGTSTSSFFMEKGQVALSNLSREPLNNAR